MQERSLFSATTPLLAKKTVNVPTMGDSITEVSEVDAFFWLDPFVILCILHAIRCEQQGTIVEWTAALGQAVKEGDVVALLETDKVTVDIKAELDGVIVQQFGAV